MKTVILGAGRRGLRLIRHLSEEKNDVIVIDDNPDAVNIAMNSADCIGYVGSGTSIEDLKNVSGIGEKTFEKMRDKIFFIVLLFVDFS